MKIAMSYFHEEHEKKKKLSRQLGVDYAVVAVPDTEYLLNGMEPWDYIPLQNLVKSFEKEGLTISVIEVPPPMEKIKLGLEGRDEEIENFCTFLHNIAKLGIKTVCYNWMPVIGWFRTKTAVKARGEALVTGFDYDEISNAPLTEAGIVTEEQLWENLEYFLKAVVPTAEKAGVQLAIHPDDPPVSSIRGISRILINAEAFERVVNIVPSQYNGITMCQGSFSAMGEDVPKLIRYFGSRKKIFFAHFRDIRGTAYKFVETFHEEGQQDMREAVKAYKEISYEGVIRPDHVPTIAGEENILPGYGILGNLFAIGYMKGLIEAVK